MAVILPFKGTRYNQEKVKDISKVITPPYDIISEEERERYYELHPNNIIRLILGKDYAGDDQSVNKYTRASGFFDSWRKENILVRDEKPAIYIYAQEFTLQNKKYVRKGFISLVKLEEFETGQIYPHEHTLAKPKEDRMKLMRSCNSNFSQVFAFYKDEDGNVSENLNKVSENGPGEYAGPEIDFVDIYGVRNILWAIKDKEICDKITLLMKDKPLFIADGHHRYETALFYRDQAKQENKYTVDDNGFSPFDYVMMMCVSMDDPGLQILPTHRMVRDIEKQSPEEIKNSLSGFFDITDMGRDTSFELLKQKLKDSSKHSFVLYIGDEDRKFYMLNLNEEKIDPQIFENEFSEWRTIDTGILHRLILDKIFGIQAKNVSKSDSIKYFQSETEAIALINEGKYQVAFFLNPTGIDQIRDIAVKRHKMPPKATYFYPKLMTGLVLRHIS